MSTFFQQIMASPGQYPLLKDRFLRSTISDSCSSPIPAQKPRPVKYKKWTEEHLKLAYEAVIKGELSIREAYNVPKSTLHDRLTGKVPFGKLSGQLRYLSDSEEAELINFLKQSAKSKADVIAIVQRVVNQKT